MMDAIENGALTFDGPAVYRIRVHGKIPSRLSGRLEGMSIEVDASALPPLTTLTGNLQDQASLAGVLRTLYEMHLPVLSVECLNAGRV
jgi:hypothetical protein